MAPTSILFYKDVGHSQEGAQEVVSLFGDKGVFDGPKPVRLLERLITLANLKDDSIVLDFFSGSATTAHALMKRNSEKQSHCKFILVQIPEEVSDKKKNQGYKNICEIGKERIRRAAKKIHLDNPDAKFDDGFRVLKLDTTNMNDVYYAAGDYTQDMLKMMESNVKDGRTDLDLLFGCLLDWRIPLSFSCTSEKIDGSTVLTYNSGDLVACFDENISESAVMAIARRKPLRAVFRGSGFASSPERINVGEIFKFLSPDTRVKVI